MFNILLTTLGLYLTLFIAGLKLAFGLIGAVILVKIIMMLRNRGE